MYDKLTPLVLKLEVNTMFTDALAPCIARSSAAMVLTLQDERVCMLYQAGLLTSKQLLYKIVFKNLKFKCDLKSVTEPNDLSRQEWKKFWQPSIPSKHWNYFNKLKKIVWYSHNYCIPSTTSQSLPCWTNTAQLCFVVVMYRGLYPYPSGLLYWYLGDHIIVPMLVKQPWRIELTQTQ